VSRKQKVRTGEVVDAVITESGQQRHDIWHIREAISDAQKGEGASIKNDLSIPISRVTDFIAKADRFARAWSLVSAR